ncbi:MAG: hypothetical protein VW338_00205 [Rhodospirillaceae bacterium]
MRLFKNSLAAVAVAAALIVGLASAPVLAQTVTELPGPEPSAKIQRATGKTIDFSGGNSTTTSYDVFDFGFTSDLVKLCILPGSATVHFRLANAVTNSPTAMATALAAQRATAPISTSAAFITGANVYGSGTLERSLPLATGVISPASAWTQNSGGFGKECTVFPFRTPGLVAHVVSGIATVEAWAVSR